MVDREYILCAAVWYPEIPLKKVIPHNVLPFNCDRGLVFCGWRHGQCIYTAVSITGLRQCESGESIQGFLTNKNKFVTREEAWIIAERENQIIKQSGGHGTLYSEDLY